MTVKGPSVVTKLNIEVTYSDGKAAVYRTNALDNWRLEEFLRRPARELGFTEMAFLAFSAAQRVGDTYKPRKASTDRRELFEGWLSTVDDVCLVVVNTEVDAAPLDEPQPEK
jgi:hypothetical protein